MSFLSMLSHDGLIVKFVKFGFVGVINTAIGFSIIAFCMYALGLSPELSNVIGFACGLCVSFFLNSHFTFQSSGPPRAANGVKFIIAFAIAYAFNFVVLLISLDLALVPELVSQLIAMACYTVAFFLLSQFFVFKTGPK